MISAYLDEDEVEFAEIRTLPAYSGLIGGELDGETDDEVSNA